MQMPYLPAFKCTSEQTSGRTAVATVTGTTAETVAGSQVCYKLLAVLLMNQRLHSGRLVLNSYHGSWRLLPVHQLILKEGQAGA